MKLSESGGLSGCHPAIRTAWIGWTIKETVVSGEPSIGYYQFLGFGHMG